MMKNKYKVLIITCWILLIIALTVKLIGADIFNIVIKNETFINVCNWLDNHWLKYVVSTIFYVPSTYLIYLSMTDKKIGQDWWVMLIILPFSYIKAQLNWVGLFLDLSFLIIVPLIRTKCKNWLKVIIGLILIVCFELISLFVRNLNLYLESNSILIGLILSIDYYIMILLYYLYSRELLIKKGKRKEVDE